MEHLLFCLELCYTPSFKEFTIRRGDRQVNRPQQCSVKSATVSVSTRGRRIAEEEPSPSQEEGSGSELTSWRTET